MGFYNLYGDVGAFACLSYSTQEGGYTTSSSDGSHLGRVAVNFNANRNKDAEPSDDYFNPMGGHATGVDNHPYAIKLLPILIF